MTLAARLMRRQAYLDQLAENAGRLARVALSFDTVGAGELKLKSAVDFEVAFVEEPVVMTGVALVTGSLTATQFPNVSAGVWKWQKSSKGLYTGAWLYFVCDVGDSSAYELNLSTVRRLRLRHSIVFEGDAIKMFPVELLQ